MEIAFRLDQGLDIDGQEVKPGKVLFFAGENNEDNRLRLVQTCLDQGVDPKDLSIDWVDGSFQMNESSAEFMKAEAQKRGAYDLVVIDASTAYFHGEDENSNTEMHSYYQVLRSLTKMEGGPLVVVLSHPAKNSKQDNLNPRGGSAVYGTIDGNLTLWMDKGIAKLHHMKWRGSNFPPLYWRPKVLTHSSVRDSDGVLMSSVRAVEIDASVAQEIETRDEVRILQYVRDNPKPSQRDMTETLGLSRGVVGRNLKLLVKCDEVRKDNKGKYCITSLGTDRLDGKTPKNG